MNEQKFKERCAEILRNNITFSPQIGYYVIHGALDELWKLHKNQKNMKYFLIQAAKWLVYLAAFEVIVRLLSAPDTLAVIIGVILLIALAYFVFETINSYIQKLFKTKNDEK